MTAFLKCQYREKRRSCLFAGKLTSKTVFPEKNYIRKQHGKGIVLIIFGYKNIFAAGQKGIALKKRAMMLI